VVQDFVDPQDVQEFADHRSDHDGRNIQHIQERLIRNHRAAFIRLCGTVMRCLQGTQVLFFPPSICLS
jgi:hypothetical protein